MNYRKYRGVRGYTILVKHLDRFVAKFPDIDFEIKDERTMGNHLFVYVIGGYATFPSTHVANGSTVENVIEDLELLHECGCEECRGLTI